MDLGAAALSAQVTRLHSIYVGAQAQGTFKV